MPAQGESNSLRQGWDSSQQHARTRGIRVSLMCALYYLRVGLSQLRFSNSSQQHARTGGVKHSPTCELDYQVRTNSEVGQLTAACPHRGVNSSKDRGGLRAAHSSMPAQGEPNSLRQGWDSSQQHARTRGIRVSLMSALYYLRVGLSQLRFSNSSQQHARTGGVKHSPTCELDYQVRTNSGVGQLTAACPHRGVNSFIRFRLKTGEVFGQLTAACRHRENQNISYVWIVLSQGWTKATQVFEQLTAACPYRGSQTLSYSTTLYYSSTTLYYKVLLQYYSGLQSATKYYSSTTLYDNLLLQYYSVLQSTATYYRITYETSFTLRGATRVSLQLHQILRLPRKMVLMIDIPHIWNVIYNARSNKHHPPTSPNTAPATLHDSHDWSSWHMKHHLQCAEQQASPSNLTKYCACHEKWCASSVVVTYETSFTMRGATGITLQPHQILCLPRKMMRIIGCRDSWNVIYNARSNRHHPPTSPNTAPATKNDAHHWSSSHMKRHLQCAEQQASPSNLTKYCTCHAKWLSWLMSVTYETSFTMRGATSITLQPHQILRLPRKIAFQNLREIVRKQLKCHLQCAADSSMIRTWSEHDPTMNSSSRTRPFAEVTFRASKTHFVLKITTFRAPAIYPDFTEYCACHEKWHSKITKYCTCHEKWFSWLISVTYETSFTMRGATSIALQPHQILRLPRKMALMIDLRHIWNVIYNARSNRHHPPTSPNTAPATQKCTPRSKRNSPRTVPDLPIDPCFIRP